MRPVFALPYDFLFYTMQERCVARQNVGKYMCYINIDCIK